MRMTGLLAASLLAATATFSGAQAAVNLIANGDFSAGNTAFTHGAEYAYVAPSAGALVPEGLYTIASDPNSVHPSWISTPGSNPELIVNGATSSDATIWQESGLGSAGTYAFSANVTNICCNTSYGGPNEPSEIIFQYSTDGSTWTNIASQLTAPPGDAGIPYLLTANFTTTGAFDIRAINSLSAAGGNDFALDNISVTAAGVPEPATWTMFLVGFLGLGAMARMARNKGALGSV